MVRINKEEIKGITDTRKKSACAEGNNNVASKENKEADAFCCEGDECHLEWADE